MRHVRPDVVECMRNISPEAFEVDVPFITELVDAHAGETVFVIAAGPSAAGDNFTEREKDIIRSHTTIRVNHPIDWLDPTYLVRWDGFAFEDADNPFLPLWERTAEDWLRYRREGGTKVILCISVVNKLSGPLAGYVPDYVCYNRTFRDGFTDDSLPVNHTTTTGALWLAVLLGAARIVILGLDLTHCEPEPGSVGYGRSNRNYGVEHDYEHLYPSPLQGRFNPYAINKQCRALKDRYAPRRGRDIEFINGNPDSLCDVFPRVDIHEFLAGGEGLRPETCSNCAGHALAPNGERMAI